MVEREKSNESSIDTHGLEGYRIPTIVCPNCGHQIAISFDTDKSLFAVKVEFNDECR